MITIEEYFGDKIHAPEATDQMKARAVVLTDRINALLEAAKRDNVYWDEVDPDTGSQISGSKGGHGDGGFRFPNSTTGAPKSQHKEAQAGDVYDPADRLDNWLTDEILEAYGLYREHPDSTPGWCHFQSVAPHSGHRTFTIK